MSVSPVKVFKFGGASVRDAPAVRNVASILRRLRGEKLVVVVSAMGKTTNALEEVHKARFHKKDAAEELSIIRKFHEDIIRDLFGDNQEPTKKANIFFDELQNIIVQPCSDNYDREYDRIIGYGELLSSAIIQSYLQQQGLPTFFVDARQIIHTDNRYRDARVIWEKSDIAANAIRALLVGDNMVVVQGFIGCGPSGEMTSLGREGSDFTASIIAYLLNAESTTIWKDVPGMLNADPKWFKDTVKLDRISYHEAIELAYYGAGVIHPKTIKPLQNKRIPLYIKSFVDPAAEGSVIQENMDNDTLVPSYIFKKDQLLISLTPKDFSFVAEDNLKEIFEVLSRLGIRIHLMENSAISFSICLDEDEYKRKCLFEQLGDRYNIRYNNELTLMTIRHYDSKTLQMLTENKEILLEQRSRHTVRMIMR
ncbi:MAG: aspartate kinase [Crocinitomicaceae bacterium]|nr:aspartate kinase [Crocinitomicaceae bacterium]